MFRWPTHVAASQSSDLVEIADVHDLQAAADWGVNLCTRTKLPGRYHNLRCSCGSEAQYPSTVPIKKPSTLNPFLF